MVEIKALPVITDDDETIKAALAVAHIPSLVCSLVHLTGNAELVKGDIRPVFEFFGDPQGGLTQEQQQHFRDLAFEALKNYRDNKGKLPASPQDSLMKDMVSYMIGQDIPPEYGEYLAAELSLNGEDPYAPPGMGGLSTKAKSNFKIVVVGAGMSGLVAGIRLQQAGIAFTIIERHPDVGGTWFQIIYPGCRVDSSNHMYCYSFKPNDWPQHYSRQEVLREYFAETADEYRLRRHIQFDTEVESMTWDDSSGIWSIKVADCDETISANAIISCVGQLNRPRFPDIPGRELFSGPSFHSTEWEYEHDLKGKKVLVIGTGASAFQFVPHVAKQASEVKVFQRSAPWMAPIAEYMQDIPKEKHWCLNNIPYYGKWFRFAVFWRSAE
ncbi:MAG: NAD(P)/FAD-dependent oxidoreductase, partial [Gammaproteobacteria bacterium]|nr:NAD(P)/FAD-dependent oxidoreductase [Gammaproteobacteria bacterium]